MKECNICSNTIKKLGKNSVSCSQCLQFYHITCAGISKQFFTEYIVKKEVPWFCYKCYKEKSSGKSNNIACDSLSEPDNSQTQHKSDADHSTERSNALINCCKEKPEGNSENKTCESVKTTEHPTTSINVQNEKLELENSIGSSNKNPPNLNVSLSTESKTVSVMNGLTEIFNSAVRNCFVNCLSNRQNKRGQDDK